MEFPRLFSRGSIEASASQSLPRERREFPRLFSRGSIEATIFAACVDS